MAFQKKMPLDIMRYILTFKDPTKQVGVKGGIKTDSAQCMPIDESSYFGARADAALFILNLGTSVHYGKGQGVFHPNCKNEGYGREIFIYSADDTVDIVFDTTRCCLPDGLVKPPSELWLQCEPCGPDLELYDVMRG